jgi:polyphosphate kinase 2 (PPK2 family)
VGKKERKAAHEEEAPEKSPQDGRLKRKVYEAKLDELHMKLVKTQYWIKATGKKLAVLVEGREAGRGGAVKCISEPLNPRGCCIVALGWPSDTQRTQWYFQRYVAYTCPPPERSSCSTAVGTTEPGWNTSWVSAPQRSTSSSCAPARSSSVCWSAPA